MRPTKYNDDLLALAKDYISNYEKHGDIVPSVVGVSAVLGISRQTANQWKNDPDKAEFSDTLERIKDRQHRVLLNKGLTGEFNASITKLMLHNFGYSDKGTSNRDDQNLMVVKLRTNFDDDYKNMSNEELDAIIRAGEE